jgi:hypothetical protein
MIHMFISRFYGYILIKYDNSEQQQQLTKPY